MNYIFRYTVLLIFCLLSFSAISEDNQIIFKLENNNSIESFLLEFNQSLDLAYSSEDIIELSEVFNIWILTMRETKYSINEILAIIHTLPSVSECQLNHDIGLRQTPNDLQYTKQWQYQNRAVPTGVIDADIDANEAWNITTGGNTVDGTEIVVAVIDDGFLIQHPDLQNNIWINENEIPDNNIDDDENGFIDDIHGWNFRSNNADISNNNNGNWHGTPVAGIIGAIGDNGIGVSGVNWNVKVMPIVKGSQLSSIIESYEYIYKMRKLFNDSNGTRGAFIVTSNASFGMKGQPLEAPSWCNIFDELGKIGVLNIGATANQNINIDLEGDLPTACPSDFLISVTNTTKQDKKESYAGYGKKTIDLGAPGSESYTLSNDGLYDYFGGTSAAAPHVAGVVALMYSVNIPELMGDAQLDPEKLTRLIKELLLNGTDKLTVLDDITMTGGRLNAYKAILNLYAHYNKQLYPQQYKNDKLLFPNPTTSHINLHFSIETAENVTIDLYNQFGISVIKTITANVDAGDHEVQIDINKLTKGLYYLQLNANTSFTYKVVKQ